MLRVIVAVLMISGTAWAQMSGPPADPELENQFRRDVEAVSADAARAFAEGNEAREAMRFADALVAYRRAAELAPKVDHPHRRLCWALEATGDSEHAVEECELALSLAPASPYNKSALATVLTARNGPGDRERGLPLARAAAKQRPDDVALNGAWCSAVMLSGNAIELAECSERLLQLDPNGAGANLFASFAALNRGDYEDARWRLSKARDAGLPQPAYDSIAAEIDKLEQDAELLPFSIAEMLPIGGVIVGVWFCALLLLFGVGSVMSKQTLRIVDHAATDASGSVRERRLLRTYRLVLTFGGFLFYASLPLMIVAVLAFGLGVLEIFDRMGAIPIYLLWVTGAMVVITIIAVLRSLFVRTEREIDGVRVELAKYPKLRTLLDEVAAAVGTRSIDNVYLVPDGDIAVFERGGLWRVIRRKPSERVLVLGVAQFDGMTQLQLRSILAHEYGHFRNEDTAGGGFAIAVRRSLLSLQQQLSEAGGGGVFNPVWWFARFFLRLYSVISFGASRLQEVLADRWAVQAYGTAAFVSGYRHIVAREIEAADHADKTLAEVLEHGWALPNLFDHDPEGIKTEAELAADVEKRMNVEPTVEDSHPSPRQRIESAERLAIAREPQAADDAKVWELFGDPEPIERAVTAVLRASVYKNLGISIEANDRDDDQSDAPRDTAVTST